MLTAVVRTMIPRILSWLIVIRSASNLPTIRYASGRVMLS